MFVRSGAGLAKNRFHSNPIQAGLLSPSVCRRPCDYRLVRPDSAALEAVSPFGLVAYGEMGYCLRSIGDRVTIAGLTTGVGFEIMW